MAVDMGSAVAYLLLDATNFNTALQGAQGSLVSAGKVMTSVGATMTGTVTRGLVNLGKTAVTESANFESAMSQVRATMLKSTEEFSNEIGTVTIGAGEKMRTFTGNLTDFALEMASTTKFTASETAAALNYMALAGYDTQESMQMLPNVLSLAAAGAIDLARASDMVTDTQTAFGISFERTTQLVDEMAKAASTGNTSVEQLGEAFLTVGGLTKNLNGGIVTLADGTEAAVDGVQELEIALTAMANAGIKGGEAGTHMRNVLLKLASPTSEGVKQFKKLGVEVFNSQGKMRSLSDVFGDLNQSLGKLTQEEKLKAIGDIFNVRDIAAAEALLSAVDQDWDQIGGSILKAKGAADEMSKIQLDNLNGQITILKSGLQTLAIRFGNLMLPVLKKVVDYVQRLTNWLNNLDDAQKTTVMRIALIAAAIGPVLLIAGRLVSMIGLLSQGFAILGSAGAGGALLVSAGLIGLVALFSDLYKRNERFRKSVQESFKKIKKSFDDFIVKFQQSIRKLSLPIRNLVDRLSEPFAGLIDSISSGLSTLLDNVGDSIDSFSESIAHVIENVDFEKIFTIFSNISDFIFGVASEAIPALIEAFGALLVAAEPVLNSILGIFEDISGWVKENVTPVVKDLAKAIKDIAESEEVKQFFEDLSVLIDNVSTAFGTLWEAVQEYFDQTGPDVEEIAGKIIEAVSALDDLVKGINDLFNKDYPSAEVNLRSALEKFVGVWQWADEQVDKYSNLIQNGVEGLVVAVMTSVANADIPIISEIASGWLAVHDKLNEVKEGANETVSGIMDSVGEKISGTDYSSDGEKAVGTMESGLKSGWGKIVSWFNGLSILNFGKKVNTSVSGFSGGGAGGSFATGLDYVPRTMAVTVHRGERILTQKENEQYNKGGSVEVVTYQNDEAIKAMNSTMHELLDAVNEIKKMGITLDSKKLVGGLVNEMDRQLGAKVSRNGGGAVYA